ncbi:MAG: zinc metallopeptidase [Gammaproteobacteria bacterium]|nr:zinc metallopeptidase [Gammaproteobacteria bacterium]MDH4253644.1 zinc metallopeptidase [Gammaproteobacteria bacterium]MDH5309760.1 zinc metallopeptidase [Gammaproteobacteria bacterium]
MPLLVFGLLILALVFGPGIWVQRVLQKYSEPADRYPGTGADLARQLLDSNGLQAVKVEEIRAGDHYDPDAKAVRLATANYNGRSLTAITVAAHEVGHALQDRDAYTPLRLRSQLVRATRKVEKIGAAILMVSPFLGAITRAPALGILMFGAGFVTLLSSTVVHFVTLPTELDASYGRALPLLDRHRILMDVDRPHARRLLKAAALTYVAASLMSLLNVARWFAILRR